MFESLCRAFVSAAFGVLTTAHVLPAARFNPYLRIGRDYFGDGVGNLPELSALESWLSIEYPGRFNYPSSSEYPEFASHYCFSFLEASIARCVLSDQALSADSLGVSQSIEELWQVLEAQSSQRVSCRVVSHLKTDTGKSMTVGDFEVVPDRDDDFRYMHRTVSDRIAGASRAYNRDTPVIHDPPLALLVCREEVPAGTNPFTAGSRLARRHDRFILNLHLIYAATTVPYWQVTGSTTLVSGVGPYFDRYISEDLAAGKVRRTTTLDSYSESKFVSMQQLLEENQVRTGGMATTSFDTALHYFSRSFLQGDSFDKIVDLSTALEGALIGADRENDAVLLRLRTRAVALLAGDQDPPEIIDSDIRTLYGLRSAIVHGGNLPEKRLRKDIAKVSSVSNVDGFGVAMSESVDRLRDLVRRAILARLCLASGDRPRWPLDSSTSIDIQVVSEGKNWRNDWLNRLADMGIEDSAQPCRPGANFVSPDER